MVSPLVAPSVCQSVCVCVLLTQWRLALCNAMDCSPLGSSVHEILQMLGQIISQFLSSIDILYVESPVIPQGLKLCSRLVIFRAELGLDPLFSDTIFPWKGIKLSPITMPSQYLVVNVKVSNLSLICFNTNK